MKTLLEFLNGLPVAAQESFAERCGTSIGYLRQIAYGHRKCVAELAINIERESKRAVTCEELCPTADWAYMRAERRRKGPRRTLPDRRADERSPSASSTPH
jgi:DNA-binding transcriptional regulator YdaS (Cro superfamily)